ncbi:MAG TPA: response regulator transcription factor [Blastocatellia bacterium]|nr:response regulator transcription factor [Blastocatellia bacterium]
MRILIVDDNDQMRRLIKSIVSNPADEVFEANDGSEALSKYAACRPDWVLMDIEMKAVDGLSATRTIRRHFPDARIVMVTEYDDPDWREEARAAGACGYVLKENLFDLRRILSAPSTS